MITPSLRRTGRASWLLRRGSRQMAVTGTVLLLAAGASAAPAPYPQAVANGEAAARAVLARAGRESCLRGKLTRALLGLSDSCAASGTRNALCTLVDQAVVVTPMSLAFMDDTSRQMLDLIVPVRSGVQAAARPAPSTPQDSAEP